MDGQLHDDLVGIQDEVRRHFGWEHEHDARSAVDLRDACEAHPDAEAFAWSRKARFATLTHLKDLVTTAKLVVLVGAAALREEVARSWPDGTVFVAADGAVGACLGLVTPVCVVTDLDGGEHLTAAVEAGVPLVVHAHGDNRTTWERLLAHWTLTPPRMVLTHQSRNPLEGMVNPGGFTDGDRAACLVRWLGVENSNVVYLGFSTERVGSWSGVTNPERKLEKLRWMAKVLDMLSPAWREKVSEHGTQKENETQA